MFPNSTICGKELKTKRGLITRKITRYRIAILYYDELLGENYETSEWVYEKPEIWIKTAHCPGRKILRWTVVATENYRVGLKPATFWNNADECEII